MKLEKLYENKFVTVEYDKENAVMWYTCVGIVNVELGIAAFQAVLNKLDETPLKAAIFNCMKMKGTFTKMNSWINSEWYPAIIPQGYICWAMATTDIFSRFAGGVLINTLTPKEITAKIFSSMEKTENWVYNFIKE